MAIKHGIDMTVTRLMLEVGLMCASGRDGHLAEQIVAAVRAVRTDVPHPRSTLGLVLLFQGRIAEAIDVLEEVLREFPYHQLGKSLLGYAYRETGRRGWEQLLKDVIDDDRDEWAIKLARETLGYDYRPAAPAGRRANRPSTVIYA